jgi:hypothetical protein
MPHYENGQKEPSRLRTGKHSEESKVVNIDVFGGIGAPKASSWNSCKRARFRSKRRANVTIISQ